MKNGIENKGSFRIVIKQTWDFHKLNPPMVAYCIEEFVNDEWLYVSGECWDYLHHARDRVKQLKEETDRLMDKQVLKTDLGHRLNAFRSHHGIENIDRAMSTAEGLIHGIVNQLEEECRRLMGVVSLAETYLSDGAPRSALNILQQGEAYNALSDNTLEEGEG